MSDYQEKGMGLVPALDCGCGCGGIKKSDTVKLRYAFYAALVFILVSNPYTYELTGRYLGDWVSSGGCPKMLGLLLHAFVFMVLLFLLSKIGF